MARPQNELSSSIRSFCIRLNLTLISAAVLLLSSSFVTSFSFTTTIIPRSSTISSRRLNASREKEPPVSSSTQESWSRRNINGKDSRFGVRRRVRSVLERAKTRTGIKNASEQLLNTKQSSPNILADAASIGGLGDSDDFDVSALDFTTPTVNGSSKNGQEQTTKSSTSSSNSGQVDAIRSDIPAAVATTEPLPFVLPELTDEQRQVLLRGERLQEQTKMGRDGSGYVVVDVKAPEYVVWECLLDFESYTETIPTVRKVTMLTSTHTKSGYHSEKPVLPGNNDSRKLRHYGKPSLTRAAFTLSKFRLNIAAIHTYRPHPQGHYMDFCLDPDCTNLVLKAAKGIWYTQPNPEGRGEVCLLLLLLW